MTAALYTIINGNPGEADVDGYFEIPGNFTSQFTAGEPFVAVDSNGSPATVQGAISTTVFSSAFVSGNTQIVPADSAGNPLAIPVPNGSYTTIGGGAYSLESAGANPDIVIPASARDSSSTSLTFPGRSVLNFGENINENFYNLMENFANNTAPLNPVIGQLWYDTAGGQFYYWDGGAWVTLGTGGGGSGSPATIGIGGFSFEYEVEEVTVASKTVFTLSSPYTPTPDGSKLQVYVNGAKYQPDNGAGGGYQETDSTTVTFTDPVTIGKIVEFYKVVPNVSGSRLGDLTDVIYQPGSPSPETGDVLTFDGSDWTNQPPDIPPALGSPTPEGTYTSSDITVDEYGRVTAAADGGIPGLGSPGQEGRVRIAHITVDVYGRVTAATDGGPPDLGSPNPAGSYTGADITVDTFGRVTAASSNTVLSITTSPGLPYNGPNTEESWAHGLGSIPDMVQVFIETPGGSPGGDGLFAAGTRISLNHPLDVWAAGSPPVDDGFGITVDVDATNVTIRVASNGIVALAGVGSPGTNDPQILTPLAWNFIVKVIS